MSKQRQFAQGRVSGFRFEAAWFLFALASLPLAACGDGARVIGAGDAPASEVQYLVHAAVDAPDGRVNYFVPVESLEAEAEVDLSRSLEIPGTARLYAPKRGGFFSVGSSGDLTVSRYDVSPEGQLGLAGVLSFQNQGITNLSRTMAFIDESKAYYLDESNARIIVWDPRSLVITGSIDLSLVARPGMSSKFVRVNYPIRPGRLLTTVTWADPDRTLLAPETGLLVIDTDQDTVLSYEVDTRCMGAAEVVELPNGDIYFASGPDEVVGNTQARGQTPSGCVLRVKADEERFDPDYVLRLSDLTSERVACDILPTAEPDVVLFRVLDETRDEWSVENEDLGQAEAWEWWRLDVTTGAVEPATSLGFAGVYTTYSRVDGRVLLTRVLNEGAESQFFEVDPTGTFSERLRSPGFLWAATRVR